MGISNSRLSELKNKKLKQLKKDFKSYNQDFVVIDEASDLNENTSFNRTLIVVGPIDISHKKLDAKNIIILGDVKAHFTSTENVLVCNGLASKFKIAHLYKASKKLKIDNVYGNIRVMGYVDKEIINRGFFESSAQVSKIRGAVFDAEIGTVHGNILFTQKSWNATDFINHEYNGYSQYIKFNNNCVNLAVIKNISNKGSAPVVYTKNNFVNFGVLKNLESSGSKAIHIGSDSINAGTIEALKSKMITTFPSDFDNVGQIKGVVIENTLKSNTLGSVGSKKPSFIGSAMKPSKLNLTNGS